MDAVIQLVFNALFKYSSEREGKRLIKDWSEKISMTECRTHVDNARRKKRKLKEKESKTGR